VCRAILVIVNQVRSGHDDAFWEKPRREINKFRARCAMTRSQFEALSKHGCPTQANAIGKLVAGCTGMEEEDAIAKTAEVLPKLMADADEGDKKPRESVAADWLLDSLADVEMEFGGDPIASPPREKCPEIVLAPASQGHPLLYSRPLGPPSARGNSSRNALSICTTPCVTRWLL
jgi:hypothetical protein